MPGENEALGVKIGHRTAGRQSHHMKTGRCLGSIASIVAGSIVTIVLLNYPFAANSCGLEPTVNGGFSVSYPGSLDVAVAVAKARREGLLPDQSSGPIPNEILLQEMLADLKRLQSRLYDGRTVKSANGSVPFSLVLVGPSLWSQFNVTPDGVQANYHTDGPSEGTVVVLTHPVALRAMLNGSLSIEQASDFGLIRYSGGDITPIQKTFEFGFQAKI